MRKRRISPTTCATFWTGAKPICPEGERSRGVPVWRGYRFEELAARRVAERIGETTRRGG